MKSIGVVKWDMKHGEWATHFAEERGEYGNHLIVGHTTGNRRYGSARNIRDEPPDATGRKPSPLRLA